MPEYKVTDNNLLFGGIPVNNNRTDIVQLSLLYSGEVPDALGSNTLGLRLTGSPGGLTGRNKTEHFALSRAFARADYVYGTVDLARTQPLPLGLGLLLSGHAQLADGNLLGSEQLGLGGVSSVRGFNEGIVYGDQGYLLRAELHAPVVPLERVLSLSALSMPLDVLVFYDRGTVGNIDLLPGEPRWNTLESAGVGFRFAVDRHVAVSFDYGWRLNDFPGVDYRSRGHFSITLSY
jgi:hemolysin activation/secretion protein